MMGVERVGRERHGKLGSAELHWKLVDKQGLSEVGSTVQKDTLE